MSGAVRHSPLFLVPCYRLQPRTAAIDAMAVSRLISSYLLRLVCQDYRDRRFGTSQRIPLPSRSRPDAPFQF